MKQGEKKPTAHIHCLLRTSLIELLRSACSGADCLLRTLRLNCSICLFRADCLLRTLRLNCSICLFRADCLLRTSRLNSSICLFRSRLPASDSPTELLDLPVPSRLPASNSPIESALTVSTGISGAIRKHSSEPLLSALGFFFMADCFQPSGCNKCSTSQLRCLGFICSPFTSAFMDG